MLIESLREEVKDYFYKRKMKKQRAKRKYSDDMCWDLQYTLLEILPKMIETLRKGKYSYPEEKFEEVDNFPHDWIQRSLKELEKDFDKADFDKPNIKNQFTRWHLILKRMSYCLIQADETQTEIKNTVACSAIYNDNTQKYDITLRYAIEEKNIDIVDEGLTPSKKLINTIVTYFNSIDEELINDYKRRYKKN